MGPVPWLLGITADSPAVVSARPLQGAKLPPEWTEPLAKGRMAVLSGVTTTGRLTQQRAYERNAHVAQLAKKIVVSYSSPGGSLADQLRQWLLDGLPVDVLLAS